MLDDLRVLLGHSIPNDHSRQVVSEYDDYFDLIYCNQVFGHVRNPHALLRVVHRVPKKGGPFHRFHLSVRALSQKGGILC